MFTLRIETDNAAFEGADLFQEVARILRVTERKVLEGVRDGAVLDANDNTVGEWRLKR